MMKKLIIGGFITLAAVLMTGFCFSADNGKMLTVVGYIGKAEIKSGWNWKVLSIDDKVSRNDYVRVLKKGDSLELASDSDFFSIPGDSIVKVDDLFRPVRKKTIVSKKNTIDEKFIVETSAAAAGVRGAVTRAEGGSGVVLSPQYSFVVTGKYKGQSKYQQDGSDWKTMEYGIRLNPGAVISIEKANDSLQLLFFDKSETNLTGPVQVRVYDILASKMPADQLSEKK